MTTIHKDRPVGQIPSGLFIVCARDKNSGQTDGYLASWIQQVSFSPLMVSVAIKPGRPAYDLITSGQVFTINIVGDHAPHVMKHFWKGHDPENNPFNQVAHKVSDNGGVLLNDAKAVIECRLHSKIRPGDHEVVFAEVIEGYVQHEESRPHIHLRKSGLDY